MSRIVKKPDERRQELIEIATRQFINQGYEKTSIRSIVKDANGKIGMFYHYFSSKEEIFEAVLKEFNTDYVASINQIVNENKDADILTLLEYIFLDLNRSLQEYGGILPKEANTSLLTILHQSTMHALHPIFCELIVNYIKQGEINPPKVETHLLVDFLLFGMSAIIHDRSEIDIRKKVKTIKTILIMLLNITPSI